MTLFSYSSSLYISTVQSDPSCSWLFLYTYCFLSFLTPSSFFNGMLAVSQPGAPNCYTLFCLISLALFVSRNLTLIHLLLFESLHSLLCDLITPTPGLAFSFLMPRTLAAASSLPSVRAYPSRNFLPPLFFHLSPSLIM